MSILMKENTIFEEVEKKCRTFINNTPVMDKYKKREVDAYFFDKSIELDLKKAAAAVSEKRRCGRDGIGQRGINERLSPWGL